MRDASRLLRWRQRYAPDSVALGVAPLGLHGSDNILKVAYAAGEAVDPRDHQHVTAAEEVEDGAKLLTSCGRGAGALLRAD
jgi:hypothetical protein